ECAQHFCNEAAVHGNGICSNTFESTDVSDIPFLLHSRACSCPQLVDVNLELAEFNQQQIQFILRLWCACRFGLVRFLCLTPLTISWPIFQSPLFYLVGCPPHSPQVKEFWH